MAIDTITYNRTDALRALAPNSGSYLNEVCLCSSSRVILLLIWTVQANPYELAFQKTFWGSNYPRLLAIKRAIDPKDVFWCQGCAGSERWNVTESVLCRV
jgi:hypothetical protein